MSEYWVSKKKYFCKYCDIYIADDAPSRQQHENGLRHKGNVDRFIRGLYKAGEKRKKDQDEEKRELARVEQAAQAAYAQDVAAGRARPGSGPVPSTSTAHKKPPPKPSNPYANYSTAASLGFSDPDAARIAAEAERRRTQGVAGEWEVVSTINPTPSSSDDQDDNSEAKAVMEEGLTAGVKREAEVPVDEEDTRAYKLRKKGWASGLDGGYDPDAIPIKLKKKEPTESPPAEAASSSITSTSVLSPKTSTPPTGAPKWTKVQWKKAGEAVTDPEPPIPEIQPDPVKAKPEASVSSTDNIDSPAVLIPPSGEVKPIPVKVESPINPESSSSGMFRKRKVPAAGGARGQRL